MIKALVEEDYPVVTNYLVEEYEGNPEILPKARAMEGMIHMCKEKFGLFLEDGTLIGFYAMNEKSPSTVVLVSFFIAPKYRRSKKQVALFKHAFERLDEYKVVLSMMFTQNIKSIKEHNTKKSRLLLDPLRKRLLKL